MINIGNTVKRVEIYKTDNYEDSGNKGYEITVIFDNREYICEFRKYIPELENREQGIYHFINNEYIQIENHE